MLSIAILSNKGGVGKSTISVNLSILLAQMGKNVCLLDFDFGGPNLYSFFNVEHKAYLNDVFNKEASTQDCLINMKQKFNLPGNLYVAFADPSAESVEKMLNMDPNTAFRMLEEAFRIKRQLKEDPYKIDYFIIDTAPGLSLTTVNSLLLTDLILFIVKFSNSDLEGTMYLISGLLENLTNQTAIIANNIPKNEIEDTNRRVEIETLLTDMIKEKTGIASVSFWGWIPSDSDLMNLEFQTAVAKLKGEKRDRMIHAIVQPDHSIVTSLKEIMNKLPR